VPPGPSVRLETFGEFLEMTEFTLELFAETAVAQGEIAVVLFENDDLGFNFHAVNFALGGGGQGLAAIKIGLFAVHDIELVDDGQGFILKLGQGGIDGAVAIGEIRNRIAGLFAEPSVIGGFDFDVVKGRGRFAEFYVLGGVPGARRDIDRDAGPQSQSQHGEDGMSEKVVFHTYPIGQKTKNPQQLNSLPDFGGASAYCQRTTKINGSFLPSWKIFATEDFRPLAFIVH
jgi:hypothetical protein